MTGSNIANVYASSIIEIGQKNGILDQIEEELRFLSDLVQENNDLKLFLDSPSISKESKKDFVKKVFTDNISEHIVHVLYVLIDNDRQSVIPEIYITAVSLIDEIKNRLHVTITVSEDLDNDSEDKILGELKEKYKKDIILHKEINPEILGGIIIRIGDLVIDGSLRKDLKNIEHNLIHSKIRSEVAYED